MYLNVATEMEFLFKEMFIRNYVLISTKGFPGSNSLIFTNQPSFNALNDSWLINIRERLKKRGEKLTNGQFYTKPPNISFVGILLGWPLKTPKSLGWIPTVTIKPRQKQFFCLLQTLYLWYLPLRLKKSLYTRFTAAKPLEYEDEYRALEQNLNLTM